MPRITFELIDGYWVARDQGEIEMACIALNVSRDNMFHGPLFLGALKLVWLQRLMGWVIAA